VPTFLQYGSRLTIGSQPGCDANAFRGTLDQLRALITGGNEMSEWTATPPSDPSRAPFLTQGNPGYTGQQRDTALAFAWQASVEANKAALACRDDIAALSTKVDSIKQPTQAQIDAAVLKALQDQVVLKGIGDAIASHIHVT
jgi:hypothetical protein